MKVNWIKIGGIAAIIGPIIFVVLTGMAIVNYSDYNPLTNYLSDLGFSGTSAIFFNAGCIIAGIAGIFLAAALYKISKKSTNRTGPFVFLLGSISLIGVGVLSEQYGMIHTIISAIFFGLIGISILFFGKGFWEKEKKLSYISLIVAIFIAAFLASGIAPLLEHLAVAAIIIWSACIGIYVIKAADGL